MALGGGMSCVKYLLFCFNLLFAITGMIILIVGAKAMISLSPYIDLTGENFYTSGPVVLIIVGVIVFIVAFFGCCGAVKENHCMIITFSIFLLVIFVAELAVGIAGYVKHQDLENSIIRNLNATIKDYPTNPDVKNSFDIIQTDLKCCGIYGPGDWKNNSMPIPDSCCSAQEIKGDVVAACKPENVYQEGCYKNVVSFLNSIAAVLGGVGLGIAAVQLLGVIFACCLARSIRSQYETV
ncbi:CD63 antigen [Ostrinia nubilalis]|uniref:CD63 antigen n=1 Tax=Ostrinia furnacalis TaxID=93504 RepID=UPI00103B78C0|nr:CD63 antigen [Ostrinia furnacalis]